MSDRQLCASIPASGEDWQNVKRLSVSPYGITLSLSAAEAELPLLVIEIKVIIHRSKIWLVSRDRPNFNPCMSRLIQPAGQIFNMRLLLAAIASSSNRVLAGRKAPRAHHWQNTIVFSGRHSLTNTDCVDRLIK